MSPPQLPRSVTWLSMAIVVACISGVLALLFRAGPVSEFQQFCVLGLLSFALSTVACLLFTTKHAEFKFSALGLAGAISGTSAVWIIAFVISTHLFKHDFATSVDTPELVRNATREEEHQDHWLSYAEWKTNLDTLQTSYDEGEDSEIAGLLEDAYSPANGHTRPVGKTITELYVYDKDRVPIAITRVEAEQPIGRRAEMHHAPRPSTPGIALTSCMMAAVQNGYTFLDDGAEQNETWLPIQARTIDTCSITRFGDAATDGDWLVADIPRYTDGTPVDYTCSILAKTPIDLTQSAAFEVKTTSAAQPGEVPLIFRRLDSVVDADTAKGLSKLKPWLQELDAIYTENSPWVHSGTESNVQHADKKKLIVSIGDKIGGGTNPFSALVAAASYSGKAHFSADSKNNSVVTLFFFDMSGSHD